MRASILLPVILAAALVAGGMAAFVPNTTIDGYADDAAAAARVRAFAPGDLSAAAAVVLLLDEKSVNHPALKSMPRALMGPVWSALTEKALDSGARKVALDFILAFDPADLRLGDEQPLKGYDAPFLRMLLREGRAGRLVLGRSKDLTPARRFAAVARERGMAFVDILTDGDGVARRMPLGLTRADGAVSQTLSGALLGRREATTVLITPPAPLASLPIASVIDVLACDDEAALAALFDDRVVLVGSGLPAEDRVPSPDRFMPAPPIKSDGGPCDFPDPAISARDGGMPGVLLHAAAVDAEASGWALRPATALQSGLAAALAATLAAAATFGMAPVIAGFAAFGVAVAGFAAAAWAQEAGVLLPAARPAFAALLGFAAAWAARHFLLGRRARALRLGFGRYVAPELVERLLEQDRLPELDGEQRHITVMFADLSGFTALSERTDSKTLTATVNAYLGLIADEVGRGGGYVDKFIGDAVMALWNAPANLADHERAAARAAVAIRDAVDAAAARDAARGMPTFAIKIGLSSGSAVVGNVGSSERLNYTAVGDTVNVAARLEGLPSVFKTPIVIGAGCAAAAADDFAMLEIGSIQVKGRQEPVAVFAPYGRADEPWFAAYGEAREAYRAGRLAAAAAKWRALAEEEWAGADLSAAMAELAEDIGPEIPERPWSGAIVMRSK